MIAEALIKIEKTTQSKLKDISLKNIPFGKVFTDHMLLADCIDGEWQNVSIMPYQTLALAPSLAALHYGQAIFEGIKAYKNEDGEAAIFRPYDNYTRFNISAKRMAMPDVPEDIFMEGMRKLVELDSAWIPNDEDHSLYIRPFMFSSDELIGVRPSDNYKFMIILSPTGPYYAAPMRIKVEEQYVRAVPGGVGFAKAAGNYGSAMYPTAQAKLEGFDQVLWMDAMEHKYVQECGTMNVFFVIGKTAYTPDLGTETILAGVTRNSVMTLLQELGYAVEEKALSIDEIIGAYKNGSLTEVFGTGTAATISKIKALNYKGFEMEWDVEKWVAAPAVKAKMDDIKYGRTQDSHNWLFKI
jgi:branched-chain amino acid aminotransferase